ncbi:MAG: phenylalanine--tRNA ligase subunit beta [bacterium]
MKILYSRLKELIPGLEAGAKEVAEVFTYTGLMTDGLKAIRFNGKSDYLISVEVRQNRADCLSIVGLAREIAAYYGLNVRLEKIDVKYPANGEVDIKIEAKNHIERVLAVEISGIKNGESPKWLKEMLGIYDVNSVNLLVDLSNYTMLYTGYPSHLLDKDKIVGGRLYWSINNRFNEITTLYGSVIKMAKTDELLIRDENNPLGLAGIVGGKVAAISKDTNHIIAEMAIYDRVLIRKNSRDLKIVTEASHRLEKDLDPNGLDYNMALLVSMILKYGGGKIVCWPFSYYPKKRTASIIAFDPEKPARCAGIKIPVNDVKRILNNLRFNVVVKGRKWQVTPPTDRMDVSIEEDITEEVIRMFGYKNIPSNEPPAFPVTEAITPNTVLVAEKARDILSVLGFDEALSWPMTKRELNNLTNYEEWESIATQNSVNEEYPDLRQTLMTGLYLEMEEYLKKNITYIRLFEIGNIFGKIKNKFIERQSLAILINDSSNAVASDAKSAMETVLRYLGFTDINYRLAVRIPVIGHPRGVWEILIDKEVVGIIYRLKPEYYNGQVAFCEINLSLISELIGKYHLNPAVELLRKIVTLDANIELPENQPIKSYLDNITKAIGERALWEIGISDAFNLGNGNIRYTIRVSYQGLTDPEAKEIHRQVFETGLNENQGVNNG